MNEKKKPLFLRRNTFKVSAIGKKRKKKQKWRRARGRDNKTRLMEKGYGKMPKIGYSSSRETRNLVNGLQPLFIKNINDLNNATNNNFLIISRTIGRKKRIEIMKKIKEKNLKVELRGRKNENA